MLCALFSIKMSSDRSTLPSTLDIIYPYFQKVLILEKPLALCSPFQRSGQERMPEVNLVRSSNCTDGPRSDLTIGFPSINGSDLRVVSMNRPSTSVTRSGFVWSPNRDNPHHVHPVFHLKSPAGHVYIYSSPPGMSCITYQQIADDASTQQA